MLSFEPRSLMAESLRANQWAMPTSLDCDFLAAKMLKAWNKKWKDLKIKMLSKKHYKKRFIKIPKCFYFLTG